MKNTNPRDGGSEGMACSLVTRCFCLGTHSPKISSHCSPDRDAGYYLETIFHTLKPWTSFI